jgi:hypothetical protein
MSEIGTHLADREDLWDCKKRKDVDQGVIVEGVQSDHHVHIEQPYQANVSQGDGPVQVRD